MHTERYSYDKVQIFIIIYMYKIFVVENLTKLTCRSAEFWVAVARKVVPVKGTEAMPIARVC